MAQQPTTNQLLLGVAMIMLIVAAQAMAWLAPLDRFLGNARFHFGDFQPSNQVVLVAIDKKSLDTVGVWPWPRAVHAQLIDRLRDLGAQDIVFDIDFSTPSNPENDLALASAIERANGAVTLPVFLQHGDASGLGEPMLTAPIDAFANHAWLAAVNVFPDTDGKVRQFPWELRHGETAFASIPATIAGHPAQGEAINIDFGIDASRFDVISVADLLAGVSAGEGLSGKTVIVGAFATELRDFYTVPRHGVVPGALLQAIAAETLIIERNLRQVAPLAMVPPVCLVLLALVLALRGRTSTLAVASFSATMLVAEGTAVALYIGTGWMVPTAVVHVLALTALGARLLTTSEFFRRLSREATTDARNVRQVLHQVFHDNFDAIVVADEQGRVLKTSKAVADVFGIDGSASIEGSQVSRFLPKALTCRIDEALAGARSGHQAQTVSGTLEIQRPQASPRTIEYSMGVSEMRGTGPGRGDRRHSQQNKFVVCLTARDITERAAYQEQLRWLSDRDQMTGTWRRHAFARRIHEAATSERQLGVAVVVLNLHRFKTVNVALGRETGNALLKAVAERLRQVETACADAARLGGDTFAVLLQGIADERQACDLAARIVDAVSAPYPVARGNAKIGVHAGVAYVAPSETDPTSGETVIDQAEMALDEARVASGSSVVVYDQKMAGACTRSRVIERDLWQALDRDELHLAYQVQVKLADRKPCGAEALLRWTHPELGNVPPDEFIGIAEANGFIVTLGRWVLFTACHEAAGWADAIPVSVNVAAQQLQTATFVDDVKQALAQSGLPAERLTIELVETELLQTDDAVMERMRAIRSLGVTIALDDFGTGYSGVGYISRLRFDKIKLDRQFTRDIATSIEVQGIVRSVVVLCDAFNMSLVCEGIETRQQEAFLRLIGCQEGQGYRYSKPIDAGSFRDLLATPGAFDPLEQPVAADALQTEARKSA